MRKSKIQFFDVPVPDHIMPIVETYNDDISKEVEEFNEDKESKETKHAEFQRFYRDLISKIDVERNPDVDCNWISTDWWCKFKSGALEELPNEEKSIDNTMIICEHNKLNIDTIKEAKRISPVYIFFWLIKDCME